MRVVLEQALKDLPSETAKPIWDKFVAMQHAVGDLSAIMETESRRDQALNVGASSSNDLPIRMNALIDRYKFCTLYPCKASYAKTIEDSLKFLEIKNVQISEVPATAILSTLSSSGVPKRKHFVQPDTSKMIRFQPAAAAVWTSSTTGVSSSNKFALPSFPLPPTVLDLLYRLPPRTDFRSVFPDADRIMSAIVDISLGDLRFDASGVQGEDDGVNGMDFDEEGESGDGVNSKKISKGKINVGKAHRPPPHDIYRKRQLKKQHV